MNKAQVLNFIVTEKMKNQIQQLEELVVERKQQDFSKKIRNADVLRTIIQYTLDKIQNDVEEMNKFMEKI